MMLDGGHRMPYPKHHTLFFKRTGVLKMLSKLYLAPKGQGHSKNQGNDLGNLHATLK